MQEDEFKQIIHSSLSYTIITKPDVKSRTMLSFILQTRPDLPCLPPEVISMIESFLTLEFFVCPMCDREFKYDEYKHPWFWCEFCVPSKEFNYEYRYPIQK